MARGTFDFDTLTPNLKRLLPVIDAAVDLTFDHMEPVFEGHMRQTAPWRDRTGNARNGLKAKHEAEPMVSHTMVLYHSMPYGYWLEVRWSGRYAVIGPTMLAVSPELVRKTTIAIDAAIARLPK